MILSRRAWLAGLVTGSVAALSGCGFRLRGTGVAAQARYNSVYLRGLDAVPAELASSLTQQLRGLGVLLVQSLAEADVLIELGGYQRRSSRTSVNAQGETTSELVRVSQRFKAQRIADENGFIDTEVVVMRDRQIDPAQLLAAARELEDIERQMQQDAARQLVDRVNRSYARLPELEPQPRTRPALEVEPVPEVQP